MVASTVVTFSGHGKPQVWHPEGTVKHDGRCRVVVRVAEGETLAVLSLHVGGPVAHDGHHDGDVLRAQSAPTLGPKCTVNTRRGPRGPMRGVLGV